MQKIKHCQSKKQYYDQIFIRKGNITLGVQDRIKGLNGTHYVFPNSFNS